MYLPLTAVGSFGFAASLVVLFRTREVLRFRSEGTIRPGSISDWRIWVWRLSAGLMAVLSLTSIYLSVVEF